MAGEMQILLVDNYDSFTYNLYHYLCHTKKVNVTVLRNDAIRMTDVSKYDGIVLSPGPGLPQHDGCMMELLDKYFTTKKILGICLGHQAIGMHCGFALKNLSTVLHGVVRTTTVVGDDMLFDGLARAIDCGRYHSWVVDMQKKEVINRNKKHDVPKGTLQITAVDTHGEVMAVQHDTYNVRGVQFHPESVMTPQGLQLINNWLHKC